MTEFTTSQVLDTFNINRNTFQDWLDRGFVVPSIKKSSKQGESNIFSFGDLCRIYAFQKLMLVGLTREKARDYSDITFENYYRENKPCYYIWKTRLDQDGFESMSVIGEMPKNLLMERNQFAFILNLSEIKKDVEDLLKG